MNIVKNRISLYLSPKRDRNIRLILEDVPEGDRADFLKELVIDGIKFRKGGNHNNVQERLTPNRTPTEPETPDLSEIVVTKKILSHEELESQFDDL